MNQKSDKRIIDGGGSDVGIVIEVRCGPWGTDEIRRTYVAVDALLSEDAINEAFQNLGLSSNEVVYRGTVESAIRAAVNAVTGSEH